jgi:hypothetical protein
MTTKFYRKISTIKINLIQHFNKNKWLYIMLLIFCILGLITGILTVIKSSGDVTINTIKDTSLINYLICKIDFWNYVFSEFLSAIIGAIIVLCCSYFIWTLPIIFAYICIKSFCFGIDIVSLIILNGLNGVINVVIIIIPINILILICLFIYLVITYDKCVMIKKFGKINVKNSINSSFLSNIFFLLLIDFLLIIIEGLLLSIAIKFTSII